MVKNGVIDIPFKLDEEAVIIGELIKTYQSVPMSLADACLVRMSEQYIDSFLLTFDSDFVVYRRHKNQIIPVIMAQ